MLQFRPFFSLSPNFHLPSFFARKVIMCLSLNVWVKLSFFLLLSSWIIYQKEARMCFFLSGRKSGMKWLHVHCLIIIIPVHLQFWMSGLNEIKLSLVWSQKNNALYFPSLRNTHMVYFFPSNQTKPPTSLAKGESF